MKYVDTKYLLYYLPSPPHTVRTTCTLSYASIPCKRDTLPAVLHEVCARETVLVALFLVRARAARVPIFNAKTT